MALVVLTFAVGVIGWLSPAPRDPTATWVGVALLAACAVMQIALVVRAQRDDAKKQYTGRLRR